LKSDVNTQFVAYTTDNWWWTIRHSDSLWNLKFQNNW